MNRLLRSFWLRILLEESGEVAVTSEPAVAADPTPVSSDPVPVSTDQAPVADPAASTDPVTDPNDPATALLAAMDAQLGVDEPAADPNAVVDGQEPAIPEAFQQALAISDFVKSPEGVQQAVRAADEVWKVATGQLPARQMLEGFKNQNPQQFEAIVADLKDYLGVTSAQSSPLDALKTENPDAFNEIAKFYQQVTGKAIDGTTDPFQKRVAELEERVGREDRERKEQAFQQQVRSADDKGWEFVTSKLKGTFAEGQESFMMPLIAAKVGDRSAAMQEILSGNTKTLEKAIAAVKKDLAPVIKAFNANLIKQSKTLQSAVPAGKGNPASKPDAKSLAPLPGESAVDHANRLWKEKLV